MSHLALGKIQNYHILITDIGTVICGNRIYEVPGCTFAYAIGIYHGPPYHLIVVKNVDNHTEILILHEDVENLLHRYDHHVNIINMYPLNGVRFSPLVICTDEGMLDVIHPLFGIEKPISGEYYFGGMIYEPRPEIIGICSMSHQRVSKDFVTKGSKVDGFSRNISWIGNIVRESHDHEFEDTIDGVYFHSFQCSIMIALCDGKLIAKSHDQYVRNWGDREFIPGRWLTPPKNIFDSLYAVNDKGVLMCLALVSRLVRKYLGIVETRTIDDNYFLAYDKECAYDGGEVIDVIENTHLHGMKVFAFGRRTKRAR